MPNVDGLLKQAGSRSCTRERISVSPMSSSRSERIDFVRSGATESMHAYRVGAVRDQVQFYHGTSRYKLVGGNEV